MLEALFALVTNPEALMGILFGVAAFAAVLGTAAPMMQADPLKERMKLVEQERERLKSQRRAAALAGEVRLRDVKAPGIARQMVDVLHLNKIFEAEPSRDMLRQAGLRGERHLILYLVARVFAPIGLAIAAFLYCSTVYADVMTPPMLIAACALAMVAGNYLPFIYVKNLVLKRQTSIRRAWPEALDLLLICVEAGMAVEPAFQRVAREVGQMSVPLAEEMGLTVSELSILQERRKAYENLGRRTGLPQVRAVVTSLVQSERYGTPVGAALRVLAQENRDMRMLEAERRALALPARLAVPMMLFFLPVIFVILMTPAVMSVSKFF